MDVYVADDNKAILELYLNELENIRQQEFEQTLESKGNKIGEKPVFVILNKFNSLKS